jgi:hypothetical protein
MTESKFNGICLLIAAAIVAVALVFHARVTTPQDNDQQQHGRFQVSVSDKRVVVIDTRTGTIVKEYVGTGGASAP